MQDNDNARPDAEDTGVEPESGSDTGPTAEAGESAEAVAAEAEGDPRDALIAQLEAELAAAKDQQSRALAEAENTRRRAQRDREEAAKYGAVGLARDLLSVADNLGRALAAAPETTEDAGLQGLLEGITMVEKELASTLERHHVRQVPGVGEPFDHSLHQAVVEMPSEEIEPGNVAQVLQIGYVLHDRLLRAAMVAVAKAP